MFFDIIMKVWEWYNKWAYNSHMSYTNIFYTQNKYIKYTKCVVWYVIGVLRLHMIYLQQSNQMSQKAFSKVVQSTAYEMFTWCYKTLLWRIVRQKNVNTKTQNKKHLRMSKNVNNIRDEFSYSCRLLVKWFIMNLEEGTYKVR